MASRPRQLNSLIRAFTSVRLCSSSSTSISSNLESVGFIGLGNMGSHMATNLANSGYHVTVHDINCNALERFSKMGIATKETAFEVAESSDVIVTMLPSPSHVIDVFTKQDGLLHNGSHIRPWLFIDSSTVDPQTSRNLSTIVSKCILKETKGNISHPVLLDAPVSGGVPGAEAGTLTFMVGGPKESYEAAKPLFQAMGKNSIYCGSSGNGAAAKICNNLAMAVSMVAVSEALALGQKLGIAATTLTKIFNSSSARCWSSESYNPVPGVMSEVPSSKNYDGGFSSKLMAKDLRLAMEAAKEVDLKCPFTFEALHIYTEMCENGYGLKDFSSVFRHYYSGNDEK